MKMKRASLTVRLAAVACLGLALAACTSARLNQFAEFSKAGVALADTTSPLLDAALRQSVMFNSKILIMNRTDASEQAREKAILGDNKGFRARARIFNDVKRHARLLRAYFVAIGNLADASGDSATGSAAKGLVDALGGLNPTIAAANVGGISVSSFVDSIVPMAVGAFRSAALQEELRARGDTVARELELHQAFLEAVAQSMRSEVEAEAMHAEFTQIIEPYLSTDALPRDWAERRLASFQPDISLDAVEAAAKAAENLKLSFIAATEGHLGAAGVSLLIGDIERVVTLVEAIRREPVSREDQ